MGFGVEGVTEANLTSDEFVACMFQHSWGGLVCQPLVREFASFESRRTGLKEQGCVPGSEAVSHQLQFAGRGGSGWERGGGRAGRREAGIGTVRLDGCQRAGLQGGVPRT